jgi:hypothetical protein
MPESAPAIDVRILLLLAAAFAGAIGNAKVFARLVLSTHSSPEPGPVTGQGWIQLAVFATLITATVKPRGG